MEPTTIQYIRRMPSYRVRDTTSPYDSTIYNLLCERIPDSLEPLLTYSRGLYSLDLHEQNFQQFDVLTSTIERQQRLLSTQPSIRAATDYVQGLLRPLFTVDSIPMNNLDKIRYSSNTAAGYGYVGLKRDNYLLARSRATANLHNFANFDNYLQTPYKAFARSQLALRAHPKIRHVWGAPFHTILIEGTIAQPIIDQLLINDSPIFIGRDMFKDIPYAVINMLKQGHFAYCVDFSGFDSTIHPWFMHSFFDFIASTMRFASDFDRSAIEYCKDEIINTNIVMPTGKLYCVSTGLPSGSYFTQLLGSYVNLILMSAAQLHVFQQFQPTYVLGDDSIFTSDDGSKLAAISDFLGHFGFKVNCDKSIVTQRYNDVHFLGHNFYGSRLTRDDFTLALLALHTEDIVPSIDITIQRIRSLLYDSGFNSFLVYNILKDLLFRHDVSCKDTSFSDLFLLC